MLKKALFTFLCLVPAVAVMAEVMQPESIADTNGAVPSSGTNQAAAARKIRIFVFPVNDRGRSNLPVMELLLSAGNVSAGITNGTKAYPVKWNYRDWNAYAAANFCDALLTVSVSASGGKNNRKFSADVLLLGANGQKPLLSMNYVFSRKELTNRMTAAAKDLSDVIAGLAEKKRKAEKAMTAYINFINYKIGREKYVIKLDGETIGTPVNNNFGLKLTVQARREYGLSVVKQDDGTEVLSSVIELQPGETRIVDYTATGTVTVRPLAEPEQWRSYSYYFDSAMVTPDTPLTNIWAGLDHEVKVYDDLSNVSFAETFYLKDRENREVRPFLKAVTGLHPRIYRSDDTVAGLGVDCLFTRYFWAGAGVGLASVINLANSGTVFVILPYIQAGYYLWNDLSYPFRAGAGLVFQGCLAIPSVTNLLQGQFAGIGVFGIAEFLVFYLQPAVFFDFTQFRFQITIGVKF